MKLDFYATLASMVAVLLIGRFVLKRVKFLRDYNIPEPVVGGLLVAILIAIAFKGFDFHIEFDRSLFLLLFSGLLLRRGLFRLQQTNGSVQGLILNGNGFRRLQQLQTPLFIS